MPTRAIAVKSFRFMLLGTALSLGAAQAQATTSFPDRVCDVTQFGAQGTRIWYDTEAFQKAIDSCAQAGGGTVRVPRGLYLIGPIFLKSNIRFDVEKYAEIAGAADPALYGTAAKPDSPKGSAAKVALINIRAAENVAVVGDGLIDGQGAVWWDRITGLWRAQPDFATNGAARQEQHDGRPRLVQVNDSKNILFQGVTLQNSPSFHLVLQNDDNVTIDHIKILAPAFAPNTDAIDPVDSRNVLITNNTISVGDDVVAIKSNGPDSAHPGAVSANITITGNHVLQGRGICVGSGSSGGVHHVLAENNTFEGSMYGFRIKTRRGHGGDVSDVVFRNNVMTDVQTPLVFSGYYEYRPLDPKTAQAQVKGNGFVLGTQIWPADTDPAQRFEKDKTPDIHDVTVENLVATGADRVGLVTGLPESAIRDFRLKNVRIEARIGLVVRNATVTADQVVLSTKEGKSVVTQKNGRYLEKQAAR